MSHTDPSPNVLGAIRASLTNDPSFLNTWIRSFDRSQTYNRPSLLGSTQVTAPNCCGGGESGVYELRAASSGALPYAPQNFFTFPVATSITATRRFRYPSAT